MYVFYIMLYYGRCWMYLSTRAVYDNKPCLAVFKKMCLKEYKSMFRLCFVIAYGVFAATDLRNMTSLTLVLSYHHYITHSFMIVTTTGHQLMSQGPHRNTWPLMQLSEGNDQFSLFRYITKVLASKGRRYVYVCCSYWMIPCSFCNIFYDKLINKKSVVISIFFEKVTIVSSDDFADDNRQSPDHLQTKSWYNVRNRSI